MKTNIVVSPDNQFLTYQDLMEKYGLEEREIPFIGKYFIEENFNHDYKTNVLLQNEDGTTTMAVNVLIAIIDNEGFKTGEKCKAIRCLATDYNKEFIGSIKSRVPIYFKPNAFLLYSKNKRTGIKREISYYAQFLKFDIYSINHSNIVFMSMNTNSIMVLDSIEPKVFKVGDVCTIEADGVKTVKEIENVQQAIELAEAYASKYYKKQYSNEPPKKKQIANQTVVIPEAVELAEMKKKSSKKVVNFALMANMLAGMNAATSSNMEKSPFIQDLAEKAGLDISSL